MVVTRGFYRIDETIQCRAVVVAAPPCVVVDDVVIEPPQSEERKTKMRATATWCGDWVKVAATFSEPFWRKANASGVVCTKGPLKSGGRPARRRRTARRCWWAWAWASILMKRICAASSSTRSGRRSARRPSRRTLLT